ERDRKVKGATERRSMADLFGWIISFFLLIALLVLVTYQLMCLADLEFDYINPYDFSSRINAVVFPEFVIQAVLTFFYLVTGHWIMSLFCLPYLYFNVGIHGCGGVEEVGWWKVGMGVNVEMSVIPMGGGIGVATVGGGRGGRHKMVWKEEKLGIYL
ncbi:hypothetical protein TSUD_231240, partial [Trifolium subterraneum]